MFDTRSDSASETSRQRPEWARWHATTHGVELLEAEFVSHVYERHIHETYAVGVTLKGVQRFWCRGATRDSTAGNIIVINPGDVHDGESGNEAAYAYRMIYVPVALMRSFVEDATERAPTDMNVSTPLLRDALLADEVNAAWAALACRSQALAGEELLAAALLRIAATYSGFRLPRDTPPDTRSLQRVRDYLRARVEDDVRVGELAEIAGMSRFRLTRQFQRAFGLPLHAYHLHLKLEESKRRLRDSVPITRVASELGFTDQSHFHRRFKGAVGMSPGAWRRAVQRS